MEYILTRNVSESGMTTEKMKNFIKTQLFLSNGRGSSPGYRIIASKARFSCIFKPSKPTPTV